jgi:hypothetical protein
MYPPKLQLNGQVKLYSFGDEIAIELLNICGRAQKKA